MNDAIVARVTIPEYQTVTLTLGDGREVIYTGRCKLPEGMFFDILKKPPCKKSKSRVKKNNPARGKRK